MIQNIRVPLERFSGAIVDTTANTVTDSGADSMTNRDYACESFPAACTRGIAPAAGAPVCRRRRCSVGPAVLGRVQGHRKLRNLAAF